MINEYSGIVAILALLVSIMSTWIAYRAHRHSRDSRQDDLERAFSREKSEFMVRIDRSMKLFDRQERRIKSLLANIDSLPLHEQPAMAEAVARLSDDLQYLKGCQRQACLLRDEVYDLSPSGLAHHKPRFLALLEDDEEIVIEREMRSDALGIRSQTGL